MNVEKTLRLDFSHELKCEDKYYTDYSKKHYYIIYQKEFLRHLIV